MQRVFKLAVLIACTSSICVLAAQAGPVDFAYNLFHHKKPQPVQQTHYRRRMQAGIRITQPSPTTQYGFQQHPAF